MLQEHGDAAGRRLTSGRRLPPSVGKQLAELSWCYPGLNFDPATGVSKLETDVLFDSGQAELKPAAQAMLAELGRVLQSPEAGELKVMVVGFTDNARLVSKPPQGPYANNFHLSTARALTVADCLRREGLSERRIGVAGLVRTSRSPRTIRPAIGRRIAAWRSSSSPRTSPSSAGRIRSPVCIDGLRIRETASVAPTRPICTTPRAALRFQSRLPPPPFPP